MNLLALMGQSAAQAQSGEAGGSMAVTLVTFVLIILIFYFMMIRPQRKKDKEAKAMLEALKKGDKIVTIGGIHGTVVTVKEKTVIVKVDDSARIEFSKSAISTVVNKESVSNPGKKDKKEEKQEVKEEEKALKEEEKALTEEVKEEIKEEKDK